MADLPLVIIGPTASGKSDLAMSVARRIGGVEIVSVDSMQIYRGMNIGTASPTESERQEIPHHLVDIAEPTEEFTVGAFQVAATAVLADIRSRSRIPLLVGGTGLYVRAVVDDLDIPGQFPDTRRQLDTNPDTGDLYRRLRSLDPVAATRMEPTNRRRIIRALEVTIGAGRPFSSFGPGLDAYPDVPFLQVALKLDREELDRRIEARYRHQLESGFLDEVRALSGLRLSRTASQALGYLELLAHLRGELSLDDAIAQAVARTRRFARRQERWFRRDPRISWMDGPGDPDRVIELWHQAVDSSA